MKNTFSFSVFVLASVFFIISSILPVYSQVPEELSKDLGSLRVSNIDKESSTVYYLPADVKLNSPDGREDSSPIVMEAGEQLIVQGMMSLVASKDDISTLETRAKKIFGDQAKVVQDKPDEFQIKLTKKAETILEQPKGGGNLSAIMFQCTLPKGTKSIEGDLNIEYFLKNIIPQNVSDSQITETVHVVTETVSSETVKTESSSATSDIKVSIDKKSVQTNGIIIEKPVNIILQK
ncbi:MAG: hypothetical protein HQM10_22690 [Candidatus Riflebacteria bacterium]|nr:hypothetical protein [Candidatus Riflebacteria bacterium]